MLSSSGFRDALGRRDLRFNRDSGQVHECLFLRPELAAYESALRRRVGRLASIEDPRLTVIEGLEHDQVTRRVAIISRHASGLRLHEILRTARDREMVPDLTIALTLTAELLLAAHSFHSHAGVPHGAITPERVIVSPEGEVLLADYAFAEAIEAARFTPARLWREFGIAAWLGEPFSFAGDVRQCALAGIALVLGRPLGPDVSERLETLLAEVQESAMIRGGRLFADPVMTWLGRAIAAGGADGFDTANEAARECAALLTERERAAAPPAFLQFLTDLDTPAPADSLEPPAPAIELRSAALTDDLTGYPGPGPEFLPVTEPEVRPDDASPRPDADLLSLPSFELEIPPGLIPDSVPAASAETVAQPQPPPAPPVRPVDDGPRVSSPSPFAIAARGTSSSVAFDAPAAPHASPVAVAEVVAPPIAAPLPPRTAPAIEPPPVPAAQVAASAEAAIGLKTADTPIRLKNPRSSKRQSSTSLHLSDRPEPEEPPDDSSSRGWSIPWKYVAVAIVVLASGLAAATMDWSSKPAARVEPPKPVEAPLPPPPTTGSIEVLSNTPGAKVLVDGKVRGETPLTVEDLKPGRHIVVVRAPNGNVRRTVTVKVGETTKIDLAVYSGWIVVSAPIELQILENGKPIGTAGEGPIVLAAGHHTIEVANKALEYQSLHEVDIQPGEEERLDLSPKGLANLNAVPWAEVWLDGAKIGDTPLGNVSVPIGALEFIFKNPQFGERTISATITGSAPVQVIVDFTR